MIVKDYPETKTTEKKVKVSTDASPPLIKFTEEIGTSRTAKVVSQTREIHKNLSEPYKSYPDITHPRIKKIRNASKDELQHNDFQKTASIKSPKKPTLLNTEQKVSASNDNILCTDDIVNTSTSENVNAGYSQQIPSNKASKEFEGYPLVRSKKYFMTGSDIDAILKEGHTSTFPKAADRNKLSTNNENMPEITNVRNREVSIGRILPDSNAHFDHCQRNYYKEKNNLALEEEEKNRSHTANDHNKSSTNNDNNRQEIPSVRNQRSSHGIIVVESSDPQGNYSKEISKSNTQNLVLEEKKNRSHIANDNNKISRNNKNNIQEIPCVRNHRSSPSITVPDSGDAHFPRSQRYNSKEKNISNTNNLVLEEEKSRSHTVTNIFDQMKPLRESNEEKRDLEKNIESKVVKQVNAINSDIEVGEKNEKMSEESSKNVGVATNSLKDRFASYVDENVQCCKRCYPTELRKNKEKSTSKSFKLSICKCTCGNRKDDAVNACMCCPNCPVNLQFQNIFGDRFCSIENV